MAKSDFYLSRDELDSVQMKVIEAKISNSILVTGCAGSGKTLIALWKAKAVQDQEKSFLFVTYTKVLTQYMRAAIKEIGLDSTYVTHYHELYGIYYLIKIKIEREIYELYNNLKNYDNLEKMIDEISDKVCDICKNLIEDLKDEDNEQFKLYDIQIKVSDDDLINKITDKIDEIYNNYLKNVDDIFKKNKIAKTKIINGIYNIFHSSVLIDVKKFDYVIIDEAQDFNEVEIQNLVKLAKTAVHIYGDNVQQLYNEMKEPKPLSINETNERLKIYSSKKWGKESSDIELLYNHRLPKKIARFTKNIPEEKEKIKDLEDRCTKEGVSKPKIYHFATLEEQLKKITEIIENNNMEDVGILFFKNDDIIKARDILEKFNFDTECRYRDKNYKTDEFNTDEFNDLDFETQLPKLITYHSAKGLQFKNVFLPECHIYNNEARNALYVAATRSSDSLYIMHSGNLSPFIRDIDKNLYDNYEINNSEKNTYSTNTTESINIESKINSDNTDDIIF